MLEICKEENIFKIKSFADKNGGNNIMEDKITEIKADNIEKTKEETLKEEILVEPKEKKEINTSEKFSLYDNHITTIAAILIGIAIVSGIQLWIFKIFQHNKNSYRALTQFVTMMLGLIVGGYMTNLLVASPHEKIMTQQESMTIVSFIKDICLMVFAYYFGTQSREEPKESERN